MDRETVAQKVFAICQEVFAHEEFAEGATGRILDIPEISTALRFTEIHRMAGVPVGDAKVSAPAAD